MLLLLFFFEVPPSWDQASDGVVKELIKDLIEGGGRDTGQRGKRLEREAVSRASLRFSGATDVRFGVPGTMNSSPNKRGKEKVLEKALAQQSLPIFH